MKQITVEKFLELVGQVEKKIKVTSFTEPKLKAVGNPYKGVKKISTSEVKVNFDYVNDVNEGRASEGKKLNFIPKSRKWGVRRVVNNFGTCIIDHNGEVYIECELVKKDAAYYIDENRQLIPESEIEQFLPTQSKSKHQDLDKPVIINSFKVSNVKEVEIDGEKFLLTK